MPCKTRICKKKYIVVYLHIKIKTINTVVTRQESRL